MENFTYYNPVKIVFGPGEIKQIGAEAKPYGKKALLVSYKDHSFLDDSLELVTSLCEAEGITIVPFYQAVANPTMTEVELGVALAKQEGVDLVIALGGGSVMDTAKIIAAGVEYEGEIWGMVVSRHDNITAVAPETALPLVLIPTLPATSSEMNCGAVVTNPETKEKSYVFAPCLYAKVSILDPELTCSLPAYQTACGVVDAISHVLEVYLNGADDTPLQDRLMEGLIINLMTHVKQALSDPSNISIRSHIMWEACVAWNGSTLPGTASTTPMHMLAHPLSARYGITHGASLSIIMPAWMKATFNQHLERYKQFAERIFAIDTTKWTDSDLALEVINRLEKFFTELNVQIRLSECNVPEEDIVDILDDIVRISFGAEGKLAARVPLDRSEVHNVLKLAL